MTPVVIGLTSALIIGMKLLWTLRKQSLSRLQQIASEEDSLAIEMVEIGGDEEDTERVLGHVQGLGKRLNDVDWEGDKDEEAVDIIVAEEKRTRGTGEADTETGVVNVDNHRIPELAAAESFAAESIGQEGEEMGDDDFPARAISQSSRCIIQEHKVLSSPPTPFSSMVATNRAASAAIPSTTFIYN